jgi:hypothetical protein
MGATGISRFGDELAKGDIVPMLNGTDVTDVASLRSQLDALNDDAPLMLQVERMGRLQFVVLENKLIGKAAIVRQNPHESTRNRFGRNALFPSCPPLTGNKLTTPRV